MLSKSAQPKSKFTELRQETEAGERFLTTQLRGEYSLDVNEALSPLWQKGIFWKDSMWLSDSYRDKKWRFEINTGGIPITLYVYDLTSGLTIRSMDLSREGVGVENITRSAIYEVTGIMEQLTIPRFVVDMLDHVARLLGRIISRAPANNSGSNAMGENEIQQTADNPEPIIQKK